MSSSCCGDVVEAIWLAIVRPFEARSYCGILWGSPPIEIGVHFPGSMQRPSQLGILDTHAVRPKLHTEKLHKIILIKILF